MSSSKSSGKKSSRGRRWAKSIIADDDGTITLTYEGSRGETTVIFAETELDSHVWTMTSTVGGQSQTKTDLTDDNVEGALRGWTSVKHKAKL
jgi:hypothetical protein